MSADVIARALAQTLRGHLARTDKVAGPGAALVGTATGSTVEDALEGCATRATLKDLTAYDGARTFLREKGREGTWIFRNGDYTAKIGADPQEGLFLAAAGKPAATGAWERQVDGNFNVRWWGAVPDNATDCSNAVQAAVDAVAALGGGTLFFGPGTFIFQNIQIKQNVSIRGAGRGVYGFDQTTGGTVFRLPSSPVRDGIAAIELAAGGSGYTAPPSVTITGGGGTGAIAVARVSGGIVTVIDIIDPGKGYSSAPTITITGTGTGATATARRAVRVFYTSGIETLYAGSFCEFSMLGGSQWNSANELDSQGIVIHNGSLVRIESINAYQFGLEAVRQDNGVGLMMSNVTLFGCARSTTKNVTATTYTTGTVRIGCTDFLLINAEVGADRSFDSVNLPNCANLFTKSAAGGTAYGWIGEGADVGFLIEGVTSRFIGCRADINYGHGFWFNRSDSSYSPSRTNALLGCWAHGNSRYAPNSFDNCLVSPGQQNTSNRIVDFRSSANTLVSPAGVHRYDVNSGEVSTEVRGLQSDGTYGTASFNNASGSTGAPGPDHNRQPYTFLAAAGSIAIPPGVTDIRLTNGSTAVSVTDLTGGFSGQEVVIHSSATNVSLGHGGTGFNKLNLAGGQSRTLPQWSATLLRNMAGTWYEITPWAKQAAISALAVSATSGTLPNSSGTVTIANAANPTPAELLEFCRGLETKVNAIRGALTGAAISA